MQRWTVWITLNVYNNSQEGDNAVGSVWELSLNILTLCFVVNPSWLQLLSCRRESYKSFDPSGSESLILSSCQPQAAPEVGSDLTWVSAGCFMIDCVCATNWVSFFLLWNKLILYIPHPGLKNIASGFIRAISKTVKNSFFFFFFCFTCIVFSFCLNYSFIHLYYSSANCLRPKNIISWKEILLFCRQGLKQLTSQEEKMNAHLVYHSCSFFKN